MPAPRSMWLAGICCLLAVSITTARANDPFAPASSPGVVTLSEVSYNSLVNRLEALEASAGLNGDAGGGWTEVDMGTKPVQKWTGRVHFDYWAFPGNDEGSNFFENGDPTLPPGDRFLFRRLRLGMKGNILGTMEYKLEFDFANGEETAIKDAYLGWNDLPVLRTVLLGSQKRPYGLDHLNSSRHNVFLERPFVVELITPDARRLGLCSYGVSENEAYNWRFGVFIPQDVQKNGSYVVAFDPGVYSYQAEVAGRFANTIWYDETSDGRGYAHWAVTGAYVDTDGTAGDKNVGRFASRPEARTTSRWLDTGRIEGADAYQMLGLEGVINVGRVQCVGEYMNVWMQRQNGAPDLQFNGAYAYLSYFLTGEHIPWERFSGTIGRVKPLENFFLVERCSGGYGHGWGAWQLALRYSYADFTDDNVYGGVGSSVTAGVNWWWTPYSRMQFNCIFGDIQDRSDPASGNPTDGAYTIIGTRFLVDF